MTTDSGGPVKPKILMPSPSLAEQLIAVQGQRGAAMLAIVLDGVRAIIQDARGGDPGSREVLKHMRGLAREIEALTGIEIPNPNES